MGKSDNSSSLEEIKARVHEEGIQREKAVKKMRTDVERLRKGIQEMKTKMENDVKKLRKKFSKGV